MPGAWEFCWIVYLEAVTGFWNRNSILNLSYPRPVVGATILIALEPGRGIAI
jgi:hypothetical protein